MKSNHVDFFWEDCCQQQVKDIYDHYYEWYTRLENIENIYPVEQINAMLDFIIDQTNGLSKPLTVDVITKLDSNPMFFDIASYAIYAIDYLENYSYIDWHYISNILINKQKDYGTENIIRFGLVGIIVRLSDKVARLNNLLLKTAGDVKGAISVNSVQGESLIDTLIDIVGYCTIALMVMDEDPLYKNKFLLPMRFRDESVTQF